MNLYLIFALGFFAQALFFARTIAQWFKSEQEGKVISPAIYWQISLLGSITMFTYGVLRNDIAIVVGQTFVYLIYIRNLQLKNAWNQMHIILRVLAILIPLSYIGWLIFGNSHTMSEIANNEEISFFWKTWGITAQITFSFRFVYQWIFSEKEKDSVLPLGFWIISIIGSLMNFTYSIIRLDPVIFAAHSLGMFIYLRNILLHYGKGSILTKMNIPILNRTFKKISDKIK